MYLITISCYAQVKNQEFVIPFLDKSTDTCYVKCDTIILKRLSNYEFQLIVNGKNNDKQNSSVINIEDINIAGSLWNDIRNVNISDYDSSFVVQYYEPVSGAHLIYHVFCRDASGNYSWSKTYCINDNRRELVFSGNIHTPTSISNYKKGIQRSIDFEIIECTILESGDQTKDVNSLIKKCYEVQDYNTAKILANKLVLNYCIIKNIENKNNITSYNNTAYYLEHLGFYSEAIYVLENLLSYFPNRTVAYINLGDAYWGLEEKDNARQAYQKYIELMKANGKESKIPQRIFDRIK